MGPLIQDTFLWPSLLSLTGALAQEITASNLPELCFLSPLPGSQVAADYCVDGMGWARVVNVTEESDEAAGSTRKCGLPRVATIEVGILRCAPVGSDSGEPPTADQWLATAELTTADQAAVHRAITCHDHGWGDFALANWTPAGPAGGCVGGAWSVQVWEV